MLNQNPVFSTANQHTQELTRDLTKMMRDVAREHNLAAMWDGRASSVPTTGTWADGQCVKNTAPAELGTAGSKYVVLGWMLVSGNWLPMRFLTGN